VIVSEGATALFTRIPPEEIMVTTKNFGVLAVGMGGGTNLPGLRSCQALFPVSLRPEPKCQDWQLYQQPVHWRNYDYNSISRLSETQGARTLTFGYRQEVFAFFSRYK